METKLERIAEISASSPRPEFTSLYHLINKEMLMQCHKELDGNKAVGVDEITKKEYEGNLEQNIDDLVERLKRKSYKPQPSIRVYIPKSNGKLRPLGIACYEDKIVQLAPTIQAGPKRARRDPIHQPTGDVWELQVGCGSGHQRILRPYEA